MSGAGHQGGSSWGDRQNPLPVGELCDRFRRPPRVVVDERFVRLADRGAHDRPQALPAVADLVFRYVVAAPSDAGSDPRHRKFDWHHDHVHGTASRQERERARNSESSTYRRRSGRRADAGPAGGRSRPWGHAQLSAGPIRDRSAIRPSSVTVICVHGGVRIMQLPSAGRHRDSHDSLLTFPASRGCSSVGRALPWHGRGQGFDSPQLHIRALQATHRPSGCIAQLASGHRTSATSAAHRSARTRLSRRTRRTSVPPRSRRWCGSSLRRTSRRPYEPVRSVARNSSTA